jgi:FHS family L-fucose permease-like MFS transporter
MATAMGPSKPIATSSTGFIPTNYGALSTLVLVFFFWGFIASGNSVFIPFASTTLILTSFKAS